MGIFVRFCFNLYILAGGGGKIRPEDFPHRAPQYYARWNNLTTVQGKYGIIIVLLR